MSGRVRPRYPESAASPVRRYGSMQIELLKRQRWRANLGLAIAMAGDIEHFSKRGTAIQRPRATSRRVNLKPHSQRLSSPPTSSPPRPQHSWDGGTVCPAAATSGFVDARVPSYPDRGVSLVSPVHQPAGSDRALGPIQITSPDWRVPFAMAIPARSCVPDRKCLIRGATELSHNTMSQCLRRRASRCINRVHAPATPTPSALVWW